MSTTQDASLAAWISGVTGHRVSSLREVDMEEVLPQLMLLALPPTSEDDVSGVAASHGVIGYLRCVDHPTPSDGIPLPVCAS
jgi:hypothetical protein